MLGDPLFFDPLFFDPLFLAACTVAIDDVRMFGCCPIADLIKSETESPHNVRVWWIV
jgi:hypothetical protein